MRAFEYIRAEDEVTAVAALDEVTRPYAGGTDMLTRMKAGISSPERLVDIKGLELPREINSNEDGGLTLGALVSLADVERHSFLPAYRALSEAASQAATPQLRERATLGGNLLQRPRCWYFRNEHVDCWLKGGDTCPAREGQNRHHAVFGDGPCVSVHPSDLATCLTALGATITLQGPDGKRTLELDEFFAEPEEGRRNESIIRDNELVRSIEVPVCGGSSQAAEGARSVYLKAMDRKVWAFALVGVAAVFTPAGSGAGRLKLAASGVASVPWRLAAVEERLSEVDLSDADAVRTAVDDGLANASPLSENGYKVALLKRLIGRAIEKVQST